MPAPRSYTREDVVEIHLPGVAALTRETLDRCLKLGARLAEPGEFTRRAFLNGRLDLSQAEAVQEVIASRSTGEFQAAAAMLHGDFSRALRAVEGDLLDLCADVEAAIDFTDQDIEIVGRAQIRDRAADARKRLARLLAQTRVRHAGPEQPVALLYGPPNAGKSTLFNRLTGADAIVSPVPGTTRDILAAPCEGLRLLDAPGVHEAGGLEGDAVERVRREARRVDLLICVEDGTKPVAEPDGPSLRVVSKSDLLSRDRRTPGVLHVSAVTGEGIDELRRRLAGFASGAGSGAAGARFAVSVRQQGRLAEAGRTLRKAMEALAADLAIEFVALDLRAALEALGAVTGRHVSEDLLDRIFERFCLGK